MLEQKISKAENIFFLPKADNEAVTVLTNGCIRKNGNAVCGKGQALEAQQRFNIEPKLGRYLSQYGNHPFNLGIYKNPQNGLYMTLLSFPTKNHWRNKSSIQLIVNSCFGLLDLADNFHLTKIYCPPPGCGLGGLNYLNEVKPQIENILDNRFIIIFR